MKNKFNFFLNALLVLLFGMGLSTCSYALATEEFMTLEDVNYLFNYSMTTSITSSESLPSSSNYSPKCIETSYTESGTKTITKSQVSNVFNNDTAKSQFLIAFNNANQVINNNLSIKNYMFVFYSNASYTVNFGDSTFLYVICYPVNNTSNNNLPFPTFYYNIYPESNYGIGQLTLDFVTNNEDLTMRILTSAERTDLIYEPILITIKRDLSCTYSEYNWNSLKFRITTNKNYRAILYPYNNNDTLTYTPLNIVFPINQANNTLYTRSDLSITTNTTSFNSSTFSPFLVKSWGRTIQAQEPEPEEPENPNIPGGSGNTGNITNPSGDITGKVDLSCIENGITDINQNLNNIENKIPTSGDIKDSQVSGNKEFWGNTEDINPEDFENELENNFNGIMESLSGELTQNQIFESLQGAEDGFLNFFKEEQNEEFYDLAFSWPDVEFMGGVLIPAGGINISEMCREISELERLRSIIRVIFNFSVAVSLIKQIYNLILSTLGIDNPYLYEDYDEVTSINEDTGEYRQTAVRRKKIYNRRR